MAAPSIPNLNTLKSNRGLRGRGRGHGRGRDAQMSFLSLHHVDGDAASNDRIIQLTDLDASGSRLSAVNLGYLSDPFASLFYKGTEPPRRFPIINRGTFVRTWAIDRLVETFLLSSLSDKKQIISLGAGTDTRYFRFAARGLTSRLVYHEIDFAKNTLGKVEIIKDNPTVLQVITRQLGDPGAVVIGANGASLLSSVYNIHPLDLRSITSTNLPNLPNLDPEAPTLIISECCLIYLSPEEGDVILAAFTQHILNPRTPVGLIVYEPIHPNDAFGRTMISNLASRGIHMQTLQRYEDLNAQRSRLISCNFSLMQRAATIDFIWSKWVTQNEKQRVSRCEMLDEVEEWQLLAKHYCVVWGARNGQGRDGVFAEAWEQLVNQDME